MKLHVAVLGAGSFGTTMAHLVAGKGAVTLWCRRADTADEVNRERVSQFAVEVELGEMEIGERQVGEPCERRRRRQRAGGDLFEQGLKTLWIHAPGSRSAPPLR